ncbi:MAG: exodeoxyribonuclease VII large subunit [bacterium]
MMVEFSVGEFVDSINQTFDIAYPVIAVVGEVTNFKISKGSWVYFDLKDDEASIRCFTTVYKLSFPVEDGMVIKAVGKPKLHNQYGLSFTIQLIEPVGEGTIKKATELLEKQLTKEGLFDLARKRAIPYPPKTIGLITSSESAAYADFTKIINERWNGLDISLYNVLVQGEKAPDDICGAIKYFNELANPPEVIVITRGGGSAEDLWAFSTEKVTRAVAASRVPTIVAIGHEVDISLAEKAADRRASTPSNAAEIIVPDKKQVLVNLAQINLQLSSLIGNLFTYYSKELDQIKEMLDKIIILKINTTYEAIQTQSVLLDALSPKKILEKGYSIIKINNVLVRNAKQLKNGNELNLQFFNSSAGFTIDKLNIKEEK